MGKKDMSKNDANTNKRVVRGSAPAPGFETPLYHGDSDMTKKKKKKKSKTKKTLLWILGILLLLAVIGTVVFLYYFGGLNTDKEFGQKTESELGIDNLLAEELKQKGVTNIALFGVDARDNSDNGRSDSTIILSLDWDHNKIKLTSLARDTYIPIEGYGNDKLCHAYVYGGPELAIKMINQNFNLNITDYVTVNFDQLAAVIDQVGGVTLDITENERYYTNDLIVREGFGARIASSGEVLLTGNQALCYSRIRVNVGGDDARTERQRKVLNALFEKAKAMSVTEYPGLAKALLPMVKTSLGYSDCLKYASILLESGIQMEMSSIPNENIDTSQSGMIDGTWYYVYDLDLAADMVHSFIYDDIYPDHYLDEPSDTVDETLDSVE